MLILYGEYFFFYLTTIYTNGGIRLYTKDPIRQFWHQKCRKILTDLVGYSEWRNQVMGEIL